MDFVIVGLQPWDIEIGSNCKNIALELSKSHRVLYVNAPITRKQLYFERSNPKVGKRIQYLGKESVSTEMVKENLWVFYPDTFLEIANSVRPHSLFRFVNRINNKRFAASISRAIKKLGLKDFVLFNDNSIYLGFHLKELLCPVTYIYYLRDNLTKMDFWRFHGSRLESTPIQKADIVVSNSTYYETYAKIFNKNSYMIGQGCDFEFLEAENLSNDFPAVNSPIVGYVGFLTTLRLSIGLLTEIADSRPEWSIVLVGPEDDDFKKSELHTRKNVHFLGRKDVEELGYYISKFDVCINPQIVNEVTAGNYPRKIDEYLYMGKACVATDTEAMQYFKDFVELASSASEYVNKIEKLLKNDSSDARRARREFAMTHTWERSVASMIEHLDNPDLNNRK